jgi:hypothetical protein
MKLERLRSSDLNAIDRLQAELDPKPAPWRGAASRRAHANDRMFLPVPEVPFLAGCQVDAAPHLPTLNWIASADVAADHVAN